VKITFEGPTIQDVFSQMEATLRILDSAHYEESQRVALDEAAALQARYDALREAAPVEKPVDIPVDTPVDAPVEAAVDKPKQIDPHKNVTDKQKAAAKMRAAKDAKKAARSAGLDTAAMMPAPPPPASAEGMDPIEVAKIKVKTIEDLQTAYANGFQKEVFELLARFGNGAKSFREVPVEAFVPIREAIDNGALT
jgi:hypothetical protein